MQLRCTFLCCWFKKNSYLRPKWPACLTSMTTFLLKLPKFLQKRTVNLKFHCNLPFWFEVNLISLWALEFLGAPCLQHKQRLTRPGWYLLQWLFVLEIFWLLYLGVSLLSCHNYHLLTVFFSGKLSFIQSEGKNSRWRQIFNLVSDDLLFNSVTTWKNIPVLLPTWLPGGLKYVQCNSENSEPELLSKMKV